MGGNIVLTYKRKRLFSRANEPHLNSYSHSPSETIELNDSANSNKNEPNAGNDRLLQKPTEELKASPCHCEDQVGLNLRRSAVCAAQRIETSTDHDEDQFGINLSECETSSAQHLKHAKKRQKLCPTHTEQKNSATANNTGKTSVLEEDRQSAKSEFHTCENVSVPVTFTSEEADKLLEDLRDTVHTSSYTMPEVSSTLVTFSRRSKQNKINPNQDTVGEHAVTLSGRTNPAPTSFLMQLMNEIDAKTKEALISSGKEVDYHSHGTAEHDPSTVQLTHDSVEEVSPTRGQVDIQDKHHEDQLHADSKCLPDNGDSSSGTQGEDSAKRISLGFLDLSVQPAGSQGVVDCNQPLDSSDENNVTGSAIVHPLDSFSEIKEEITTSTNQNANDNSVVGAVHGKGKELAESSAELITSPQRNYLQLFPETCNSHMPPHVHNNENPDAFVVPKEQSYQLKPASMESLHPCGSYLQPEQMMNAHGPHPSLHGWNNHQQLPRDVFHNPLQSNSDQAPLLARHRMMLDNLLGRPGASRGRSNIQEIPTMWLEEELDCLWIGVRRHGRGNWLNMLKDPRLHFLPWKTPWDLAQRWEEEIFRLLYGNPVPQVTYGTRPVDLLHPRADFNALHEYNNGKKVFPANLVVQQDRQLQNPVANTGTFHGNFRMGMFNPYGGSTMVQTEHLPDAGAVKGNLPQWMREVAAAPPKPVDPTPPVVSSACFMGMQSSLNNSSFRSILRNVELQSGMRTSCVTPLVYGCAIPQAPQQNISKQDELIVIPSDASSEETISDDLSTRN